MSAALHCSHHKLTATGGMPLAKTVFAYWKAELKPMYPNKHAPMLTRQGLLFLGVCYVNICNPNTPLFGIFVFSLVELH